MIGRARSVPPLAVLDLLTIAVLDMLVLPSGDLYPAGHCCGRSVRGYAWADGELTVDYAAVPLLKHQMFNINVIGIQVEIQRNSSLI